MRHSLLRYILTSVAAICMTACTVYDKPEPLTSFRTGKGMVEASELTISKGDTYLAEETYRNFILKGQALLGDDGAASIWIHTDDNSGGYEVLLRGGGMDGNAKTGSLRAVRDLYRSIPKDGEWFDFSIAVREKNISVTLNGMDVVCYTEPEAPYRTQRYQGRLLGEGKIAFQGLEGEVQIRNLSVTRLKDGVVNPNDTLPAIDEQTDGIIRLQQAGFPVIDYHVHLKGGLTKEMAHALSMNYGINYGVAPNAGEGGVGRMLANDQEVYEYYDEVKDMPFLRGVQGEGRKWTQTFSQEALSTFDYLFTDAMTIVDHKNRISRLYRADEVIYDNLSKEQYMDLIVDQTVKILTNEPADIFANPTYLPKELSQEYDRYWTQERIDKVLDVLERFGIALEINATYKLPSLEIIRQAKARGIKFTFGTNNSNQKMNHLEYPVEVVEKCHLTQNDMWNPSMSMRKTRPVIIYNTFK